MTYHSTAAARFAVLAALLGTAAGASTTRTAESAPAGKTVARYLPYTKAAFDAARGMKRVLFFHATWCPSCRGANADIMKKLGEIPGNVVIFKADYDKETALKKQYGIVSQHSFVLADSSGKALKKWSGGKLSTILSKTQD